MRPHWVPRLLVFTAVMHFLWAFAQPNAWSAIARDGFFRAVVDEGAADFWSREATVWFMVGGVALLALGTLTRKAVRDNGRLPAQLGWYLLAMGVPLVVLYFPATGGWALVVIGVLALTAREGARAA
ncbi:DUF6463 family protein [Saccharothrix australiensis]|uniref:Uncharacterized protein n=1 Tax=Saccharothrix australiensis TaxID=2072 RepID=A0A495W2K6_9PSEU|nr:DUF6463 family protein [Saccharothrix australiensis]RKT55872.1 hypothetical protein C8E97_4560 [Saccharothrix australiensis]